MIDNTSLIFAAATHNADATAASQTTRASRRPAWLSDSTHVAIGSLCTVAGVGMFSGFCYVQTEPLSTPWGYPAMLLSALATVIGTLMIARGVSQQSLLEDEMQWRSAQSRALAEAPPPITLQHS